MDLVKPDPKILVDIVTTAMPYGKHKGTLISNLPAYYLEWMHGQGFPAGKLGMLLSTTFEIKTNGLSDILYQVKKVLAQRRSG